MYRNNAIWRNKGHYLYLYFFSPLNLARWQICNIKSLTKIYYSLHFIVHKIEKLGNYTCSDSLYWQLKLRFTAMIIEEIRKWHLLCSLRAVTNKLLNTTSTRFALWKAWATDHRPRYRRSCSQHDVVKCLANFNVANWPNHKIKVLANKTCFTV